MCVRGVGGGVFKVLFSMFLYLNEEKKILLREKSGAGGGGGGHGTAPIFPLDATCII